MKDINVEIGERIKLRRTELGISQEELVIRIGYKHKSSINKIELGTQGLTQSKIKAIADALYTTPSYIMGWTEAITKQKVPFVGEIACGKPIVTNEVFECYVELGCEIKCDFCLKAKGDSMTGARIHDGDIVFIKEQDTVENGEIAAVVIDDEATLKRLYLYQEEQKLVLQSENPRYQPLVYVGEELNHVHVIGKAVAFQSDIK